MKKRVIPAVFILVAAALAVVFITRQYFYKPEEVNTTAKVVIPQVDGKDTEKNISNSELGDEATLTSLVPLNGDETLISVVSMDFNNDGFEDQVNAIKTAASPYLSLLVGLYNTKNASYERKAVIATKITQAKTFAYTGMDLTGEHRLSLVYQGYAENGDSVLQAFFISNPNGVFNLRQIADFEADGTIFIQQLDRYDDYERSQANGSSFPIWVYSTDTTMGANSTDQLQIRYDWNAEEQKYTKALQVRVAGSKLAAKELARIQDGTVKTFAAYLDGLWYKTENNSSSQRYLFFDYDSKEIIFFIDDTEEVYNWVNSNLRRNGIYLSTTNTEIENLQRRIDISLLGVDGVSVKIQDDVRMIIGESTMWDGEYKKMSFDSINKKFNAQTTTASSYIADLEKGPIWKSSDGTTVTFVNGAYSTTSDLLADSGVYTSEDVDGRPFIECRSRNKVGFFSGSYYISYAPIEQKEEQVTPSSKKKQQQQAPVIQYNKDCIILQPYVLTLEGSYATEGQAIILTRSTKKETTE